MMSSHYKNDSDACIVCFDETGNIEVFVCPVNGCSLMLHHKCMKKWIQESLKCPQCYQHLNEADALLPSVRTNSDLKEEEEDKKEDVQEENICLICLETDSVVQYKCPARRCLWTAHEFCKNQWFKRMKKCIICKTSISPSALITVTPGSSSHSDVAEDECPDYKVDDSQFMRYFENVYHDEIRELIAFLRARFAISNFDDVANLLLSMGYSVEDYHHIFSNGEFLVNKLKETMGIFEYKDEEYQDYDKVSNDEHSEELRNATSMSEMDEIHSEAQQHARTFIPNRSSSHAFVEFTGTLCPEDQEALRNSRAWLAQRRLDDEARRNAATPLYRRVCYGSDDDDDDDDDNYEDDIYLQPVVQKAPAPVPCDCQVYNEFCAIHNWNIKLNDGDFNDSWDD